MPTKAKQLWLTKLPKYSLTTYFNCGKTVSCFSAAKASPCSLQFCIAIIYLPGPIQCTFDAFKFANEIDVAWSQQNMTQSQPVGFKTQFSL